MPQFSALENGIITPPSSAPVGQSEIVHVKSLSRAQGDPGTGKTKPLPLSIQSRVPSGQAPVSL